MDRADLGRLTLQKNYGEHCFNINHEYTQKIPRAFFIDKYHGKVPTVVARCFHHKAFKRSRGMELYIFGMHKTCG